MKLAYSVKLSGFGDSTVAAVYGELRRGLHIIGGKAVNEARNNHGYTDRTGNLTASMGYMVAENGTVSGNGGFEGGRLGEQEGHKKAEALATADDNLKLVVVAGMDYASYVEHGHTAKGGRYVQGRAVLAGAELLVKAEAEKLCRDINQATR